MFTKEEILKEIKKCAKENGGKTPSEKIFYEWTGIKLNDLNKCGWANYRELVLEANLTPNKFDKTKYNHEQLCKIFIEVIRDKNKWPTKGELEVRHHSDPNFPSSATFYKKLGLTGDLARTILEFIDNKQGHDDIIGICNLILEKFAKEEKIDDSSIIRKFSEVYLLKSGLNYKIGYADDPKRRAGEIGTLLAEKPELIHSFKTDDPEGVEKYWHKRFEKKWKRGEWFNLNTQDIKAFKRWKKIY